MSYMSEHVAERHRELIKEQVASLVKRIEALEMEIAKLREAVAITRPDRKCK